MHSCLCAWENSLIAIWTFSHKEDIIRLKNFPKKRSNESIFSFEKKFNVSQRLFSAAIWV